MISKIFTLKNTLKGDKKMPKNKCPFLIRKTGGWYYGIKCKAYHKGSCDILLDGENIPMYDKQSNKESRNAYHKKYCIDNYKECRFYKGEK
jgi:hypothetical protein